MTNIETDEYRGSIIHLSITSLNYFNPFSFIIFISNKTSLTFLLIFLNETLFEDKNFLTFAYCFSRLQNVMLTELPSDVLALVSLASSWNTSFNTNKIFFMFLIIFSWLSLPSRATGRAILITNFKIHEIYDSFFLFFSFMSSNFTIAIIKLKETTNIRRNQF